MVAKRLQKTCRQLISIKMSPPFVSAECAHVVFVFLFFYYMVCYGGVNGYADAELATVAEQARWQSGSL
tara:strand:+ start:834 stop:1040 length:207 start_codon:yes stop_codon:yes gene_type:complete